MAVVYYRHPETKDIKQADPSNDVQLAALKKLGYEKWTGEDVANDPGLEVTYGQVTRADAPKEPPALPRLTKAIPPGPTHDTSPTAPPASKTPGITREDVEPAKDKDK